MCDLVEILELRTELEKGGIDASDDDFERIYSTIAAAGPELTWLRTEVENRTRAYFAAMELPEAVTLYDELLLTLRGKDLIATFNWDPFLLQAYARNATAADLPTILFLHGNVSIGACSKCRVKGWIHQRCRSCQQPFEPSPLLFPVTVKNYESNPFISSEWTVLREYIEHAYLFAIFGYSAPSTDVAARGVLLDVWTSNQTRELAQILLIDVADTALLEDKWKEFFVRDHYGISATVDRSWQFRHPRRSCDAFAMATLQLSPCAENPLPRLTSLAELHSWVSPLVEEEREMYEKGTPLRC